MTTTPSKRMGQIIREIREHLMRLQNENSQWKKHNNDNKGAFGFVVDKTLEHLEVKLK